MLLQTLVQLNILILATPALAGWIALPMAQLSAEHTACVVLQGRAAEAVAPKQTHGEAVTQTQKQRPQAAVLPRFALAAAEKPTDQRSVFFLTASAAVTSFHPFPHAIRAP